MPRIIKPAVGSFTASNITVDSSGRIIAASSGAGAANMVKTFVANAAGTATFTAQPGTSKVHLYMKGAGGGGGGGGGSQPGGVGGHGGFGFWNIPVSQPYSVPFTLGTGGTGGTTNPNANPGQAGTASSFNTNLTANAGNGANKAPGPASGNPGTPGTITNETIAYIDGNTFTDNPQYLASEISIMPGNLDQVMSSSTGNFYNGDLRMRVNGVGGSGGHGPQAPAPAGGETGKSGGLVIYEDLG